MKKQTLLSVFIFLAIIIQAGTQPRLAGLTYQGGSNGTGAILKYKGGDTTTNFYSLPSGGCPGCGTSPFGSLVLASDGKMYGLGYDDGANYAGTVFQYDYVTNTYALMASFSIPTTGYYPFGSLMQASNGILYGLTSGGGANGAGTLFSYALGANVVTPLVSLPHAQLSTIGSLIQAADSNLYGMTSGDGADSSGTIFRYNIAGNAYTPLYSLPTGAHPVGDLLQVGADTFYGVTRTDGTHHLGTIFRYIPAGNVYTVLYNLDTLTGGKPITLIRATDGKLYGTAMVNGAYGFGSLFSFDPATQAYTDIHDFTDTTGGIPQGALYQASDGKLYGMARYGGEYGYGVIYDYNISTGAFAAPLSFNFSDGAAPEFGHLIEYGTVSQPIVIVSSPSAQAVCAGSTASFKVSATNYDSLQWQYSSGTAYSNIAGATDSVYSFTAGATQSGYLYRVVLYGGAGNDTTSAVSLTVLSAATNNIISVICHDQSITVGTHIYSASGTYIDTLGGAAANGCDSIVTLNLLVTAMNDTARVHGDTCIVTGNGATYQWYNCLNGTPMSGATNVIYFAPQNGTYYCLVTLGSCTDTTNCVTVTGVGISDISNYNFSLYPNPTSGTFIIDNNYTGSLTVEVINILGERMRKFSMNTAHASFDISTFASGMYEVRISDGAEMIKAWKVVKE